jgi:hypothetical protein
VLLQTFRELKEQEVEDEPKLKLLNEKLEVIVKDNLDDAIRIKLLDVQIRGETNNLLESFQP